MEEGPMEFDSFIRAKKIEEAKHALTAKYIERVVEKCRFSTKNSDSGVSCNIKCVKRLQDIDSESTVSAIFPKQQFTLNSFHQKFHKERWMSWVKTVPKWMVCLVSEDSKNSISEENVVDSIEMAETEDTNSEVNMEKEGMVHLVCEDSKTSINEENEVDSIEMTETEATNSEVNMEKQALQHDTLSSVGCDGTMKIRNYLPQVNINKKLVLTRWTPILVSPCELKMTGFLYRTQIKHTTNVIRARKGSHSFKCVDGYIYELRGMFSDPNNNIPVCVQKLLSKGLPLRWGRIMRIWTTTEGYCRHSIRERETTGSLISPKQSEEKIHVQKTSYGRIIVPPLKYWLGERFIQR